MDYRKYSFEIKDSEAREILIARLSQVGFDAFEEEETVLHAYVPRDVDTATTNAALKEITSDEAIAFTVEDIAQQNWNAQWEAGYEPVVIEGFCTVRAQFHPAATTPYEIVITPKMSFGTGHHGTTKLMMEGMRSMDLNGREVLDFGTGTGILAILAAKLGAARVVAIDHEEWAAENAVENVAMNAATGITVYRGSLEQAKGEMYDIVLANINRHILLQYMKDISKAMKDGGSLLLSGILIEDQEIIVATAAKEALKFISAAQQGQWMALLFRK